MNLHPVQFKKFLEKDVRNPCIYWDWSQNVGLSLWCKESNFGTLLNKYTVLNII